MGQMRLAMRSAASNSDSAPRSRGGAAMPTPASPAQAQPSAQPQQPQQPQTQADQPQDVVDVPGRDYTEVPKEMDARFEELDIDSQLRPTIISPAGSWTKRAQKALLASPTTSTLASGDQKKEKDAAFDLLDALTKSGVVPVDAASLHIVVAATHCFDKSVTETVVQDNVNPIDKVERSTLIMAGTVHQQPASALIKDSQLPRVSAASPMLFCEDECRIDPMLGDKPVTFLQMREGHRDQGLNEEQLQQHWSKLKKAWQMIKKPWKKAPDDA